MIRSLSGRLLLLTAAFVMLIEGLFFAPTVVAFREAWLDERLERAQIASLALLATPDDMVTPELEAELLKTAEVLNIVLQRDEARVLILAQPMPRPVDATYDLRSEGLLAQWRHAGRALLLGGDRVIRVIGLPVNGGGDAIEATVEESRLHQAMVAYALRILAMSAVIALLTGCLIWLALRRFLVRPMTRVIENMRRFSEDPEDPERVIRPDSSIAEIAEAEKTLAGLETELRSALRHKARLAAMGEALAKVSHDLRNLLTTAQLLADRLEGSADPRVARVGPKIIRSLDRAAALCASTLDFGKAEEPAPVIRTVALRALAEEVGDVVFPDRNAPEAPPAGAGAAGVRFVNAAPEGLTVPADPDQLHRVLVNLARNARQAMENASRSGEVRLSASREDETVVIEVSDQGPGLPEQARANLFTPFKGGATRGGAGLGLAIAAELARAHGGRVELAASTTEGAAFRVSLPSRPRLVPRGRPSRDHAA
ncbi:HAMP domain-containing sensor histidine kinase [Albimonas sp. CAU 1670]|nr:HAMP domain-containing sensor histidine kinase [Albimonas sp. CAU 1670]MDF2234861.1 HAMP domain-containing sensor histidine kinase [Albimonas sp. CAU 1670]